MRKRLGFLLLFILTSCAGIFLCVEILARLLPEPRFASNVVFDSRLGHRGPKGSLVEYCSLRVYYNQFGFRDRDYDPAVERKNGKVRIAVLGDSITEAINVTENSLWPQWMENVLNSAWNRESTSYRFSSSDWGTYQELLAYQRDASQLDPDIVVLQFLGLNDFINNGLLFAGKNRSENDSWRPYFDSRVGRKKYTHPVRQLFRSLSRAFLFLDSYHVNNHVYGKQAATKTAEKCDLYTELFLERNRDPAWQLAFNATNQIARNFRESVPPGKKILAVYFPSNVEMLDPLWKSAVEKDRLLCTPGRSLNRHEAELIFETAFRAAGIETLSLWNAFSLEKQPDALYDPTGHLTPRGHQVAGEQIAFYLYNHWSESFGGKREKRGN